MTRDDMAAKLRADWSYTVHRSRHLAWRWEVHLHRDGSFITDALTMTRRRAEAKGAALVEEARRRDEEAIAAALADEDLETSVTVWLIIDEHDRAVCVYDNEAAALAHVRIWDGMVLGGHAGMLSAAAWSVQSEFHGETADGEAIDVPPQDRSFPPVDEGDPNP